MQWIMEKVRKKSDCFYVSSQNDFVSEKSTTKKRYKKRCAVEFKYSAILEFDAARSWKLFQASGSGAESGVWLGVEQLRLGKQQEGKKDATLNWSAITKCFNFVSTQVRENELNK